MAFVRRGDEVIVQPMARTLLDMRGSVPVPGRQDFEAIREEVLAQSAQEAAEHDA